jgi:anaerobic magnesium-protoporphyrin IX monomethyl ester cyclase
VRVLLMSMPDVAPVIMHESAFHMPNLGIASIGANIDAAHEVWIADLVRHRRRPGAYVARILERFRPDVVGLSAMAWQYRTCVRLIDLIRRRCPRARIVIGGYHATLMYEEIAAAPEAGRIDFMVRGEGEEAFRRLVNALDGRDSPADIPSLSWKDGSSFRHNPRGELLDLATLRLPIRDRRRRTWGYHIMNRSAEVMETSRGCTRACNFCSMRHMYGRTFRTFPIERVLADIDDIYYKRRVRWIFVTDDNLVLDPERVEALCEAIIRRGYRRLHLVVQADCITMSRHPRMVRTMARAGFKSVFLGIENASRKNLKAAGKGDIVEASRRAVEVCHANGIMVVGGMIFGFPDDDEQDIIDNYRFLKSVDADTAYCQILTPYPKTEMRRQLLEQGLVANADDYSRYNGMWANVRTRHLSAERLQYLFWYQRQQVMGWWEPSERIRRQGRLWTGIWLLACRPLFKLVLERKTRRLGWQGRYREAMDRLARVNRFPDLERS